MKQKKQSFPKKWIGLKAARFRKYQSWINNQKPGKCGTYASGALLHDAYLHHYSIDLSKEAVLNGLQEIVEETFPYRGTFPWDLRHGLNYVLKDNSELKASMCFLPDKIVVKHLNRPNPEPVVVGTSRFLGSNYKNHWLLIYAYGYNSSGKLYFKGYDNHGRYSAVVPASQTIGCVWLTGQEEKKFG